MEKQPLTTKPQIVWLNVVRLLAMFMVVCYHSTDPFNCYPGELPANIGEFKFWGAAYGSMLRPCVPLFVMITGALLLPVQEEASVFYRKRIPRVLWPFIIWSVLYALFPWMLGVLGYAPQTILNFFPFSGEEVTRQSLEVSARYISQLPLNFSIVGVHMWYIYLLIGLYLYLPVFSAWVEKTSEKAKLWFLAAWGVTLFMPYYREYVNPYIWGSCSWNEFYMLYTFAGFHGYLLLGHYLRHHPWRLSQTLGFGIPMFVTGFLVTFLGFRHISSLPSYSDEQLEMFFYFCSPNVVLMTIPLFKLCQHTHIKSPKVCQALSNLTVCGFGIYMVHYFFTGPCILLARQLGTPICLQILVGAVFAFIFSWTLVFLLRKATGKYAKYLLG